MIGDEIPLLASVISVVDAYDAMTTVRPYKEAFSPDVACRELRDEAARGWRSRTIVEPFVELQQSGGLVMTHLAGITPIRLAGVAE